MGMTGIHRGIESSRVESRMILSDTRIFHHSINSSFPFLVLLIFSYIFIYSCGIFSPSTILILILGEAIFAQLIYSNYNKTLLRDCKYSAKRLVFLWLFYPFVLFHPRSIPRGRLPSPNRQGTIDVLASSGHWLPSSVATPRPISTPSPSSPPPSVRGIHTLSAVSPTWHSTARSDSKRISRRHRSLMPLCEIVARLACSKVFPSLPPSLIPRPSASGLSTVSLRRNRGRRKGPGFGRGSKPGSSHSLPLSSGKFSEGFERKIDGRWTGPATPPLRVPLFEFRPLWPVFYEPAKPPPSPSRLASPRLCISNSFERIFPGRKEIFSNPGIEGMGRLANQFLVFPASSWLRVEISSPLSSKIQTKSFQTEEFYFTNRV